MNGLEEEIREEVGIKEGEEQQQQQEGENDLRGNSGDGTRLDNSSFFSFLDMMEVF